VLIGDAAGLSDAFWGDGIDTALVSGTLAAAHIAAALRGAGPSAATLASYDQAVRRALGPKLVSAIERQHATRGALAQTAT
jgi:flavin-dependent dehydrogenase